MSAPVIEVSNLGKEYIIGSAERSGETLREVLTSSFAAPFRRLRRLSGTAAPEEHIWALKDVNFSVAEGEVVGIIGRNGAGKSTLLKILSRITAPTTGQVTIRGRVGSLLEVGTGFHPELTGRENIFLNGAILGMSGSDIRHKFDEIVDFSGVDKFLDTPVKRYSSGMKVRLAFAVAAHLEPEILIIDEVLAVGDVEFQRKCLGKMGDVAKSGRTVLFVSHNMAAVQNLCARCLLLHDGQLTKEGPTGEVISDYISGMDQDVVGVRDLSEHSGRSIGRETLMTSVSLGACGDAPSGVVKMGADVLVSVSFQRDGKPFRPVLGVVVKSGMGARLFAVDNRFIPGFEFAPSISGEIVCRIPALPLMPGRYSMDLYLGDEHKSIDAVMDAIMFDVLAEDFYGSGKLPDAGAGPFVWKAEWQMNPGVDKHAEYDGTDTLAVSTG